MRVLLAVDCSANLCAACVYDAGAQRELGRAVLDLGKGHAEHLMAVIAEALEKAGIDYSDLCALAVSVGPGSFTGVRVGVSTVRGLALAEETRGKFPGRAVLVALDGGREEIHAALYDEAMSLRYGPAVATLAQMTEMAVADTPVLSGTLAGKIAAAAGGSFEFGPLAATADIAVYARLAAGKEPGEKPHPLYLRAADAKPQAGFVLPRVS